MILYFSGTGNSRYVAEHLSCLLKDEAVSVSTYLRANKKGEFKTEKPYVFVTPCYMSRMPMKVEKFLLDSKFEGNKEAYFVMTAGQAIGNAGKYCEAICKKHGLKYKGIQAVQMPANYVVMYDVTDRDKAESEAQNAMPEIKRAAELIQKDEELKYEGLNGHKLFSMIAPSFTATMVKSKNFYAEDSCIHCGTCADLCPLDNISYKEKKPVWGTEFMHCMACISACPAKAIQYGKATKGRNRYYLEVK